MHDPAEYFRHPKTPLHRQYEALRAYLLEELPAIEVAHRFGYAPGYVRVLGTLFRQGKTEDFFPELLPRKRRASKRQDFRKEIIELRKRGLSIYDISLKMDANGMPASHQMIWMVLKEEGFERLPKRTAAQLKVVSKIHPPVSDVNELNLTSGRMVSCQAPLLLLFAPFLERLGFSELVKKAGYRGSSMIPAPAYLRSLLALKLMPRARKNHVMSIAEDDGFGMFTGLNVMPKTTALSDYSYRTGPKPHRAILEGIVRARDRMNAYPSHSFNLDFHIIRHYGETDYSSLEKDYVPRRSQSVPAVVTAFAQEWQSRELVYSHANLLKRDKADEVLRFVEYWQKTTGKSPQELVFDCHMTTHEGLAELDKGNIRFITLRERRANEVARVAAVPKERWERVELDIEDRKYKTPLVLDELIELPGYDGNIRQISAIDLGREEPMFLLTNDNRRGPAALLTRYARRTLIENALGEQVHFFHVDALSSSVRIKVDLDTVLSVIASGCYRWFAGQLKGFENATAAKLWDTFLNRHGTILLTKDEIVLNVRRFSRAPVLLESQISNDKTKIPWLGDRTIRVEIK